MGGNVLKIVLNEVQGQGTNIQTVNSSKLNQLKIVKKQGILENACTDTRTRTGGHGHTDRRTRTHGHGHLWKRRAVMEKTGSYGKDGHLWKRRTLMEKTDTYGKDGQLWKRRTLMEKTDTYGKDGHLWKRRTLMEKTDTKHLKPIF